MSVRKTQNTGEFRLVKMHVAIVANENLAGEVKERYRVFRESLVAAIENSIECGRVLSIAKSQCRRGEWRPFIEACGIPRCAAANLIRIYKNRDLIRQNAPTTWFEAKQIVKNRGSFKRSDTVFEDV